MILFKEKTYIDDIIKTIDRNRKGKHSKRTTNRTNSRNHNQGKQEAIRFQGILCNQQGIQGKTFGEDETESPARLRSFHQQYSLAKHKRTKSQCHANGVSCEKNIIYNFTILKKKQIHFTFKKLTYNWKYERNYKVQAAEQKHHRQEKLHKLEVLKGQWNEYYRKKRESVLCKKKELREAKERMQDLADIANETQKLGSKSVMTFFIRSVSFVFQRAIGTTLSLRSAKLNSHFRKERTKVFFPKRLYRKFLSFFRCVEPFPFPLLNSLF
jgi:hypothetical protein